MSSCRWLSSAPGLFLLSGGTARFEPLDDGLVLLCAVAFAAHILLTARYAPHRDVFCLTLVQLLAVAVMTGVLSLLLSALGWLESPLRLPGATQVWVGAAIILSGMLYAEFGPVSGGKVNDVPRV